jgi:hypothetical protein
MTVYFRTNYQLLQPPVVQMHLCTERKEKGTNRPCSFFHTKRNIQSVK